jgi:esterase/lipase superfamily enzyme
MDSLIVRAVIRLVLVAILVVSAGCQRQLIGTPNLYIDAAENPFADVPPELQTNTVDLLYVTDRAREDDGVGSVRYGYKRSPSMAFGSLVVEMGHDVSWEQLVEASTTRKRSVSLPMRVQSVTEQLRSPDTPSLFVVEDGQLRESPQSIVAWKVWIDAFYDELRRRLVVTPRKEAYIFVHGFHNTITDAAYRMAELWHFLGREGVPILYSWPAGHPGLIRGYTADHESGQFTQFHLKEFLRVLATYPELETIHVIAHSRGTDVALTAIRELILVAKARGDDLEATLKLGNIVLAAPDIDDDVADQRFAADRIFDGFERMTIYTTKDDRALGSAEWLFSSKKRIGKIRPDQLSEYWREIGPLTRTTVVDARVKTDYMGHGYFLSDPATCSDLILVLRYGRLPGAENGRPLTKIAPTYYILDKNYPSQAAPMPKGKR